MGDVRLRSGYPMPSSLKVLRSDCFRIFTIEDLLKNLGDPFFVLYASGSVPSIQAVELIR